MTSYPNLLITAILALVMSGLGLALDGQPDDITVMQLVAAEVAALDNYQEQSK